jgi:hypothetical protein
MASTSQRHVYINDEIPTSLYWGTYNNFNIEFNVSGNNIGGDYSTARPQRLSNVFLDYTYRNLSTVSNRRLFIDADGKPADSDTLAALNPIVYMPLTDAATAGSNSGTGGDFTVNGVLATAQRGPNQDNCSASTFDGSADYLSRSSITGLSDSKLFTFSFNAAQTTSNGQIYTASNGQSSIKIESTRVYVRLGNTSGAAVLYFTSPYPANKISYGQNNTVSFSCDLSDTSKRHMFINGVDVTSGITFTTYLDQVADLTHTPYAICSAQNGSGDFFNGSVGEFYLDTAYIDLATENPFWDSDTNLPNSVRKVIADTSVTPAIAMPLIGSDAGNNLGSGGDFTVNSGPYTGARGGSEFWSRSADLGDTSTAKTFKKNLGISTKIVTIVFASKPTAASMKYICSTPAGAPYTWFMIDTVGTNFITIEGQNSTRKVLDSTTASSGAQVNNEWNINFISFDLSDTSKRIHWLQNSAVNNEVSRNYGTYIDDVINLSSNDFVIGENEREGQHFSGDFGFTYVSTTFIDFSQEANRNKFVDQLGYPIDLTQQIEDGDIPNPLIYMKFEDTAALGTNSGTAGNLTVTGAPAAGSDFTP